MSYRPEYLRIVPETVARKAVKKPFVERLAALTETVLNHNPDLPAGIAIVAGITAAGFAGLLK